MKRLLISLATTGLVLAAAARSALVQAQVARDKATVAKKPSPPPDPPNQAVVAEKSAGAKNATNKPAEGKKEEAKKGDMIEIKAAVVKQAIKARARRVAVVNANANLNPMIQQFVQQGRPMMRAEVLLVHSIYHLPKDKLRELVKGAETALEAVSKEMAEYQQGGQRVIMRGQTATNPEWAKKLQQAIAVDFKKHLTPEQFARYQSEVDKRFAEHKEVGVRFLVDAIDRELLLSPKQRDQLVATLGPKWEEGWSTYLEYVMYGNQFFPQEVDRLVTPVLDDTQKKVWQGTQKVSGLWGFGGIWGNQNGQDPLQELLDEGKEKPAAKHQGVPLPK
jgi:hypothetical protein